MTSSNPFQIIFVVETNSISKTDWNYIGRLTKAMYGVRPFQSQVIYMKTKSNYKSREVIRLISFYRDHFSGQSHVVYCFDIDANCYANRELEFYDPLEQYCKQSNSEIVYFVRNIEDVIWGYSIKKSKKVSKSQEFVTLKNEVIARDGFSRFESVTLDGRRKSNLKIVLDRILSNYYIR